MYFVGKVLMHYLVYSKLRVSDCHLAPKEPFHPIPYPLPTSPPASCPTPWHHTDTVLVFVVYQALGILMLDKILSCSG